MDEGKGEFVHPEATSKANPDDAKTRAPKKEFVWFEGAGHFPFFGKPEEFTEELVKVRGKVGGN
jgi:pimeloyl-ACP methyl ester carboxylesterase